MEKIDTAAQRGCYAYDFPIICITAQTAFPAHYPSNITCYTSLSGKLPS